MLHSNSRKYGCITLSQTCKCMFFVNLFNYSSIVAACFNKIMIFYRGIIIENDRKHILNGNKYLASIYHMFNPVYSWKITMRFRVKYISRNNFELILYKDLNEFRAHIALCLEMWCPINSQTGWNLWSCKAFTWNSYMKYFLHAQCPN